MYCRLFSFGKLKTNKPQVLGNNKVLETVVFEEDDNVSTFDFLTAYLWDRNTTLTKWKMPEDGLF
jgi:hypothetical protein